MHRSDCPTYCWLASLHVRSVRLSQINTSFPHLRKNTQLWDKEKLKKVLFLKLWKLYLSPLLNKPSITQDSSIIQRYLCNCLACFSSLAWAFICWTSMVSGLRRRMYNSWLPIHSARIRLLMRTRGAKNTKSGAFLSIGLIMNFLSLNEMLRISDQGKPIFGVNLKRK